MQSRWCTLLSCSGIIGEMILSLARITRMTHLSFCMLPHRMQLVRNCQESRICINLQQIIKSLLKCNEETNVIVDKDCYLQTTYDLFIQSSYIKDKINYQWISNQAYDLVRLVQTRLIVAGRWDANLILVYYCNLLFLFCAYSQALFQFVTYVAFFLFSFLILFLFLAQFISRVQLFLIIPLPAVFFSLLNLQSAVSSCALGVFMLLLINWHNWSFSVITVEGFPSIF